MKGTISPVQTALALLKKHKLAALDRETELQDQARACHNEAADLERMEYNLRQSQDVKWAEKFLIDIGESPAPCARVPVVGINRRR